MPSLNALREFKASFADVGDQKADLKAKGIPFDDFELPASEPPPLETAAQAAAQAGAQASAAEGNGKGAGGIETPITPVSPADGFDFSAFLGSQPGDIPEAAGRETEPSAEDLYFPEGLLSGISELGELPPDEGVSESDAELPDDDVDVFTIPEKTAFADGIPAGNGKPLDIGDPEGGDHIDNLIEIEDLENIVSDDMPPEDDSGLFDFDDMSLPDEPASMDEALMDEAPADEVAADGVLADGVLADGDHIDDLIEIEGLEDIVSGDMPPEDDGGLFDFDDMGLSAEPAPEDDVLADDIATDDTVSFDIGDFDLPEEPASMDEAAADGVLADGVLADGALADDLIEIEGLEDIVSDDMPPEDDGGLFDFDDMGLSDEPALTDDALVDDSAPLDLGGLDDFSLPDEPASMDEAAADNALADDLIEIEGLEDIVPDDMPPEDDSGLFDFDDMSLPDEPASDDGVLADDSAPLDFGGFDDFGLPDEPASADDGAPLDLGGFDDFGLPDEPASADGAAPLDLGGLDDFGLPDEPASTDDGAPLDDFGLSDEPPLNIDDFDNFGLPDEPASEDGALADDSAPLDLGGLDDFSLPDEPASTDDNAPLDLGGFDDFGLPDEPASADDALADDGAPLDLGGLDDFGLPDEPASTDDGAPLDLGGLDDFGLPDEPASADGALADDGAPLDLGGLDDFSLPDEPASTDDSAPLDLGGFDDFGLPDEPASADGALADDSAPLDLGGLDDFGLPDEPASTDGVLADDGASLDPGGLDDFGLPDEPAPVDGALADGFPADDGAPLDISGLDDFTLPGEPSLAIGAPTDNGAPSDAGGLDDFGLPEESEWGGEGDGEELDSFEQFDPTTGVGQGQSATEASGDGVGADGMDDFSFPEMDDGFEESLKEVTGSTGKDTGADRPSGKARAKRKDGPYPDYVEDIRLSEEELKYLEDTLTNYPLNLRIACEEIIAENNVSPEQMSRLIGHLIRGTPAKEAASYAGQLLGRTISIPKSYQARSGEMLEAKQASFSYIFIHNFLPVLRIFMFIAVVAASLFYLVYRFVYTPLKAESIYKIGYERIFAGEYQRANERFTEAFDIHRRKNWFYRYAEAFRDQRQYIYAEQKYDELLLYYPRDKKGVLDYAYLETYYLRNYAKADSLLQRQLLDFAPDDAEGLLASGDNYLAWGEIEPARYEDARYAYARLLDLYGWTAPVVERMMKYFIRTDNLKEVLPLRAWFDADPKRRPISAATLAELGGYLLDKQLEETRGVPNEYVEHIDNVRDLLLRAVMADRTLPEAHYHLARYYRSLGNDHEERVTLELAVRTFDRAREESIQRLGYRIDTHQRYADNLIRNGEFFPAEEHLVRGINLYEDAVSRRLLTRSPKYGRLYAGLGDLEYFTKFDSNDMNLVENALRFYHRAQENGWAPPEMLYRMGAAYYQLEDWKNALEYLFSAATNLPLNRRVLYALGNAALKRGDYFAAQGYYNRLLNILEVQRARLPVLLPNDRPEFQETAERLMWAHNNAGVANEMLSAQTGNRSYLTRAIGFYAEATRAWDSLTRDPRTMVRLGIPDFPYVNARNATWPQPDAEPQIFIRIDREALETSIWETIAPEPPEQKQAGN